MAEKRIKKAVALIKDFMKERKVRVSKIIVFGSRVKGGFREDSDIDIAIISPDFEAKDIFRRADMLKGLKWELVKKLMVPFDIVPVSFKEWERRTSMMAEYIRGSKILSFS